MAGTASPSLLSFFKLIPRKYKRHVKALLVVGLALVLKAPIRTFQAIFHVIGTAVGVSLGVGFGLGLAMHVYEQLKEMQGNHKLSQKKKRKPLPQNSAINSSFFSRQQSLEDSSSYESLMFLAGYSVQDKVLRGQVLRESNPFWKRQYLFTDVPCEEQRAPVLLRKDWPSLPPQVTTELGRFVEHIMRDFIGGWYYKVDMGCVWKDEKQKRLEGILRDGMSASHESEEDLNNNRKRKMVFSTSTHRRIPMLDQTYRVLLAVFGNMATRTEHINIFSLALFKWTHVLAHTFRVYRVLKKSAEEKNGGNQVSEIHITREFLLAGKLHRAITFGLDVPSLLFADASGEECGTGTSRDPKNPNQVLEERLFHTPLLRECELDYNRMLAHRLVRAILPKMDSSSPVALALVVEIFSAFVLLPIMGLFIPSFLNSLIITLVDQSKINEASTATASSSNGYNNDNNTAKNTSYKSLGKRASVQTPDQRKEASKSPEPPITTATSDSVANLEFSLSVDSASTIPGLKSQGSAISQHSLPHIQVDQVFVQDPVGDLIVKLTAAALDDLQSHLNFDECRQARQTGEGGLVDWDSSECQAAVLRLVMIVEAVLLHGRCAYRAPKAVHEETSPGFGNSLPQVLMEMTSGMDEFDAKIAAAMKHQPEGEASHNNALEDWEPENSEISTLRTLISTWLHSGQLSRAIFLIVKGFEPVFSSFYSKDAFLAIPENADTFAELMNNLIGVDMMVETMAVLSSARLDLEIESSNLLPASVSNTASNSSNRAPKAWTVVKSATARVGADDNWSLDPTSHLGTISTPRHLDFHKNSGFASSLREERERRIRSWETRPFDESITTVHRKNSTPEDVELHKELHALARVFYNGTNLLTVRNASRKSGEKVALLTAEMISNRRRIEVPDDDSSFLLRAQPRPLNPVSVHRDDRNHDLSYKCFLATYEEPASAPANTPTNGNSRGRYIRRCLLQYYPTNRTASVTLRNDARKIDKRKGKSLVPDTQNHSRTVPLLSNAFLRERHLCQKWVEKDNASAVSSFFTSTVVETTDFNATPRSGKALDFVYRLSLFERPTIDLAGKRFTVQDSADRGAHRADASALEVSDATISVLLLTIGRDYEVRRDRKGVEEEFKHKVEMGPDGYPMLFMKTNKKQGDQVTTEMKPYRISFVRSALMVTSARQEAQLQCLSACVRSGSARSATKARTDAQLRPTLKILAFANDRGTDRSRVSSLLADLKLGVYHIDCEQLRRNGLVNPRNPTGILDLKAKVEEIVEAKDVPYPIGGKMPPATILYKIKCEALVEYIGSEEEENDVESYLDSDGNLASRYHEGWVVYRSIKDFQAFHKHLKSEVATTESSASTGALLVGAATAAFGTSDVRKRKELVPSLASKTGGLAVTKKAIIRRGELLSEYLDDLLLPNNLVNRCIELLLFLGASQPFPPEVKVGQMPGYFVDPLGRSFFFRSIALRSNNGTTRKLDSPRRVSATSGRNRYELSMSTSTESLDMAGIGGDVETSDTRDMLPAILNKVEQVPLEQVRNRIIDLGRYWFGFENASFFRSQMLAALETASFVAMTKASSFRNLLYDIHVKFLNPDALAGWIQKLLDILWPDGVWMTPRPPYTEEEEIELRDNSREKLHEVFPEQVAAILGQDLADDGLDMLHEMLQNRIVVKSLFYMLFDLLWIEVFPELRDALSCADPLSDDST